MKAIVYSKYGSPDVLELKEIANLTTAGQIEADGKSVTRFRPGDEVFAEVGTGGFAEFVTLSEELPALKPANLTFKQAATVPMAAETTQ